MVLFLWLFPAPMLSLPASRCRKLSEGGPARCTLREGVLCFSRAASPAGRWAPEGVLDSPALGRRSWQRHRASWMSFIKPGKNPLPWCSALCQGHHPSSQGGLDGCPIRACQPLSLGSQRGCCWVMHGTSFTPCVLPASQGNERLGLEIKFRFFCMTVQGILALETTPTTHPPFIYLFKINSFFRFFPSISDFVLNAPPPYPLPEAWGCGGLFGMWFSGFCPSHYSECITCVTQSFFGCLGRKAFKSSCNNNPVSLWPMALLLWK